MQHRTLSTEVNANMEQDTLSETIAQLHWIDCVGLGTAAIFLLLGLWRGLWWQVIRLLGLCAAVAVARWVGPVWAEDIAGWSADLSTVAAGLGWLSAFLLTLIAAAFLGMVGSRTIDAMKLSLVNRSLGAIAGLLTGLLLHCAVVWACSSFAPVLWQTEGLPATWSGRMLSELAAHWPILPTSFQPF
jgi:uncharacterized membrane protein required for colicin V production